jgi:hypothetical protein
LNLLTRYTFTQFATTGNYRAIAILQTLQFTVTHALGFSAFTSRILATDISQSHFNFNSHMKFSWHSLIPCLPFPAVSNSENSTQFSSDYCSVLPAILLLILLSCRTLLITTFHGSHGKHRLLLSRMRVYWSFT